MTENEIRPKATVDIDGYKYEITSSLSSKPLQGACIHVSLEPKLKEMIFSDGIGEEVIGIIKKVTFEYTEGDEAYEEVVKAAEEAFIKASNERTSPCPE